MERTTERVRKKDLPAGVSKIKISRKAFRKKEFCLELHSLISLKTGVLLRGLSFASFTRSIKTFPDVSNYYGRVVI